MQSIYRLYTECSSHENWFDDTNCICSFKTPKNYKLIQCQNETMHISFVVWLCLVFLLRYDFVGHQETLQEDAEHLLKILNLEHIKFPPQYENMTTASFVLDWFRTVPLEDRKKLYKIYEKDFRLFGYPKPVELLDDHEFKWI